VDETHVGLRIMAERAEKLGARFEVLSSTGRGTSIVLTLPAVSGAQGEKVLTEPDRHRSG
jgi:two-component system nitrate/nitrite sensor histidine kinase NarX